LLLPLTGLFLLSAGGLLVPATKDLSGGSTQQGISADYGIAALSGLQRLLVFPVLDLSPGFRFQT